MGKGVPAPAHLQEQARVAPHLPQTWGAAVIPEGSDSCWFHRVSRWRGSAPPGLLCAGATLSSRAVSSRQGPRPAEEHTQHDDNDGKGALGRDRSREDTSQACAHTIGAPEAWLLPGFQSAGLTELRVSAHAPASPRCPLAPPHRGPPDHPEPPRPSLTALTTQGSQAQLFVPLCPPLTLELEQCWHAESVWWCLLRGGGRSSGASGSEAGRETGMGMWMDASSGWTSGE